MKTIILQINEKQSLMGIIRDKSYNISLLKNEIFIFWNDAIHNFKNLIVKMINSVKKFSLISLKSYKFHLFYHQTI